ncbi:MAG: Gldg family protein [Clostridia bacterium]|nr:Gldg family protein [Clostridia bacterium]
MKETKTGITRSSKGVVAIIVSVALVLAVIALNIGAAFIPEHTLADMTSSGFYTISDETKKFVSSLEEDVTISIINADGSNAQFETFIKKYAMSGKHLNLEYVDTLEDADFLSSHGISASNGVNPYSIVVSSEKRSQFIDFYSMYYFSNEALGINRMSYSQYQDCYYLFASSESYLEAFNELVYNSKLYFCGERALTSTVEYVTLEYIPHPYFVTGHGEDSWEDGNFASLLSYMEYAYGVLDITDADEIPLDADCLIINAPTEDYSDEETSLILDYLKDGGRLLLITSKETLAMENLMSIAEYYGMTSSAELVAEDPVTEEDAEESEGEEEEYDIYELSPVINTDHDIFASFPINEYTVSISQATHIKISDSLRSAQIVTPILTTSDEAYIGEDKTKGVYNLGVAAEEAVDGGTTRMVWLSSAETFNGEDTSNTDLSLLVYAMTWMGESYESTLGDISDPLSEEALLTVSSGTATFLGIFIVLLIPATLIAVGIVIYVRRRRA